jgi:Flp pilus assembly pilin Flp
MIRMMARPWVMRFIKSERGQDLAEYGIALAVIGAGAAIAAVVIAGNVNTLWSNANSVIDAAVP